MESQSIEDVQCQSIQPTMASQPSSSSFTYDVFLSFHASDTRDGFTGNLLKALSNKGINTFNEDKDEITPELVNAINESRTSVIVLSEDYASSTLCLEELAYIVENFHSSKKLICPVFYGVDPSDVRKQRGPYGKAFARHEEELKDIKEEVVKWKNALCQVANLSGFHFKHGAGYDEIAFIERIIEEVSSKRTHGHLHDAVANDLVGLEYPLDEVCSLMEMESNSVLKIGIFGIGGVGKTTLARAVYNRMVDQFESSCFLDNVGANSKKHGLMHLQNMLLSDVVGEEHIQIESVDKGASIIKFRLQQKKVLLILDDVNTLEQLDALVGGPDWFGSGSRVIITARDRHLLVYQGIERTYYANLLNNKDAVELFILKAFEKGKFDPSYAELAYQAAALASGFPLALKTLGSFLYGKSVSEWNYALNQIKGIADIGSLIPKILRACFDGLGKDEQSIFLDIACCFNGYELAEVNTILCSHYGHNVKYHVDELIVKSLISISLDGKVTLHDMIEYMGKEIVHQESPTEPGKHSRLWSPKDIVHILKTNAGTNTIEIIHLDAPLIVDEEVVEWDGEAFKKMGNLKTLIIRKCHFSNAPKHLPSSLRVLQWWRYPSQKIPSDFDPKQLVICMLPNMGVTSPQPTELFKICKSVARVMLQISVRVLQAEATWKLVGFMSSVVGLLCYALSPSFNRLIGGWNYFKVILYGMFSLVISTTILFVKQSSLSTKHFQYKTYTKFAVLMIISVYSFFYDKAVSGKPEILSVVSNAAFSLMSLSLSKLVKLEFEVILSYFLGCLAIQLWTIDKKLILLAIIFGCPLFIMHSSSDSQPDVSSGSQVIHSDSDFQTGLTNGDQDIHSSSETTPEVDSGGQFAIDIAT